MYQFYQRRVYQRRAITPGYFIGHTFREAGLETASNFIEQRRMTMKLKIFGVAAIGAAAFAIYNLYPDFRRYLIARSF